MTSSPRASRACPPGSKAGPKGTANALVGPDGAPLNFDVYPFVENSQHARVLPRRSRVAAADRRPRQDHEQGPQAAITIPHELRQPGGLDATLTGIDQTFSGKAKKNYIVSSTKCPKGGWKFGGQPEVRHARSTAPRPPAA